MEVVVLHTIRCDSQILDSEVYADNSSCRRKRRQLHIFAVDGNVVFAALGLPYRCRKDFSLDLFADAAIYKANFWKADAPPYYGDRPMVVLGLKAP